MYAIIRTGGKQAKVHEGDVLDIERVRAEDEITFTPLLVVDGDGNVTSDRKVLADAAVTAKILGPSAGPKVDIFKYKNKSGNRRRQGHRQRYTRIEVTSIALKKPVKKSAAKAKAGDGEAKTKATAAKATEAKSTAKKPAAKSTAAKAAEKKPAVKSTAAKAAEKKPAAKSTAAKSTAAKSTAKKAETTSTKKTAKPKAKPADEES